MSNGRSCDGCQFSGVQMRPDKTIAKICRRHPPRVHVIPFPTREGLQVQTVSTWPGIDDNDWCGEYRGVLNA